MFVNEKLTVQKKDNSKLVLKVWKKNTFGERKLNHTNTNQKKKTIPDGGVAPHHLLRFRLSHMI